MGQGIYRGRIAPTPTGYLHLGHGRTFWASWKRARDAGGELIFRDEDLDPQRCKEEYARAALEDLGWLGLNWDIGPDRGKARKENRQSHRHLRGDYLRAWEALKVGGWIYPCRRSRKEVEKGATAEEAGGEPLFPPSWRPPDGADKDAAEPGAVNWRFRVPDGRPVAFPDGCLGKQLFRAGSDFGDFLVWRKDGFPAYELAVVVDDLAMGITEVVRGADLLKSTARQLLIYQALGRPAPDWYHCPLVVDSGGRRLAKRDRDRGLRHLRAEGVQPEALCAEFEAAYRSWLSTPC